MSSVVVGIPIYKKEISYSCEDLFWGYCVWNKDIDFKVPSARLASKFSAQNDYCHGIRDVKKEDCLLVVIIAGR